jgi:hypothetical protein
VDEAAAEKLFRHDEELFDVISGYEALVVGTRQESR